MSAPRVTADEYLEVLEFLYRDAELADAWSLHEWLALVTDDVQYTAFVCTTRERGDDGGRVMPLYDENHSMLHLRVRRYLEVESAWSESPHTRTRRYVTNVRVVRHPDGGYAANSDLLVTRSRYDSDRYELVAAGRVDHLVRVAAVDGSPELRLRTRTITIDQSRLGMPNLPFPL